VARPDATVATLQTKTPMAASVKRVRRSPSHPNSGATIAKVRMNANCSYPPFVPDMCSSADIGVSTAAGMNRSR